MCSDGGSNCAGGWQLNQLILHKRAKSDFWQTLVVVKELHQ
jgi:hypothetical protein